MWFVLRRAIVLLVYLSAQQVSAAVTTETSGLSLLPVSEDAFIRDGMYGDEVQSSTQPLRLKEQRLGEDNHRDALLLFNLSSHRWRDVVGTNLSGVENLETPRAEYGLPDFAALTLSRAALRLFFDPANDVVNETWFASWQNSSWSEQSVTFNNAPPAGARLGSVSDQPSTASCECMLLIELNHSLVEQLLSRDGGLFSFKLERSTGGSPMGELLSKEKASLPDRAAHLLLEWDSSSLRTTGFSLSSSSAILSSSAAVTSTSSVTGLTSPATAGGSTSVGTSSSSGTPEDATVSDSSGSGSLDSSFLFIIIGALVVVALLGAFVAGIFWRRRRQRDADNHELPSVSSDGAEPIYNTTTSVLGADEPIYNAVLPSDKETPIYNTRPTSGETPIYNTRPTSAAGGETPIYNTRPDFAKGSEGETPIYNTRPEFAKGSDGETPIYNTRPDFAKGNDGDSNLQH